MEKDKTAKIIDALIGPDRPPLLKTGAAGMGLIIGITFASETLPIVAMQLDMPHSENEPAPTNTFVRELRPAHVTSTAAVPVGFSNFFVYPRKPGQ